MMKRILMCTLVLSLSVISSCTTSQTTEDKLRHWRRGVWQLANGSYTIYTDDHYFVVSVSGDSSDANLYCGGSELRVTERGMARRQTVRIRKLPGGDLAWSKKPSSFSSVDNGPFEIDLAKFQPGTCIIDGDIIYDSVTEETNDYILLATCNGDKEKIFSDGRSVYLPAGGGEYWARRIESW
jgi:hypothetical protein